MIGGSVTDTVVIYSNESQECERMAMLLRSIGGEFLEYKLGQHFTQKAFETEFGESAEYPQVNIGVKHIGGLKETLRYMSDKGMFL